MLFLCCCFLTFACVQILPSNRPWIIAHGGASGPLPGNTLEAFQRAVAVGANFITCEVVVTKDQQVGVLLLFMFPCMLCTGLDRGYMSNSPQSSQRKVHGCKSVCTRAQQVPVKLLAFWQQSDVLETR